MCEPHLQHCMYDLSVGSFWNRTLGNELLHISSFKLQFHAYWHETQATRLFLYYAATERSFGAHWHTSSTPEIEKVFEDFSVTITLRSPSSRDPRHCHVSASTSPPPFAFFTWQHKGPLRSWETNWQSSVVLHPLEATRASWNSPNGESGSFFLLWGFKHKDHMQISIQKYYPLPLCTTDP